MNDLFILRGHSISLGAQVDARARAWANEFYKVRESQYFRLLGGDCFFVCFLVVRLVPTSRPRSTPAFRIRITRYGTKRSGSVGIDQTH